MRMMDEDRGHILKYVLAISNLSDDQIVKTIHLGGKILGII